VISKYKSCISRHHAIQPYVDKPVSNNLPDIKRPPPPPPHPLTKYTPNIIKPLEDIKQLDNKFSKMHNIKMANKPKEYYAHATEIIVKIETLLKYISASQYERYYVLKQDIKQDLNLIRDLVNY